MGSRRGAAARETAATRTTGAGIVGPRCLGLLAQPGCHRPVLYGLQPGAGERGLGSGAKGCWARRQRRSPTAGGRRQQNGGREPEDQSKNPLTVVGELAVGAKLLVEVGSTALARSVVPDKVVCAEAVPEPGVDHPYKHLKTIPKHTQNTH